jgi:hypothetical protein
VSDLVISDMGQNVFQVGARVDPVELARSCRIPDYAESKYLDAFCTIRFVFPFGIVWNSNLPGDGKEQQT